MTDYDTVIYKEIPTEFEAGRYHSWIASSKTFPPDLNITSVDEEGSIMSIEHKKFPIYAVQFHPESILTPLGKKMVSNFIEAHTK